uniref:TF-B3 domain-containing protein n=1 Tax=Nelumbo nucifera TaxID=4432 RepID=A0A822XZB6_NELNU|nr:TPA_asm: hypothetical protein HUJ06_027187 [Nelumbo nucifera]
MAKRSGKINTYEEARKQRLRDNKKRFEDLGILKISKSLSEIASSENKSPQRQTKAKPKKSLDGLELRRSSRARNPVSSYSEVGDVTPNLRKRSRSNSWKSYLARPFDEVKMASYEERFHAIESAEKIRTNLPSGNPSFVKSMVRSHVYSCFWLGLPSSFCKNHLPTKELKMVLEDEKGSEYDAIYIGSRSGLSGGWRGFALDHKLDDGDALVFELIEPTRFKVYIVKASRQPKQENTAEIDRKVNSRVHSPKNAVKVNENVYSKAKYSRNLKKAEEVDENGAQSSPHNFQKKEVAKKVGFFKSDNEYDSRKLQAEDWLEVAASDKDSSPRSLQQGGPTRLFRKRGPSTKLFRKKAF